MSDYECHVALVSGRGAVEPAAATGAREGGGDGPAQGETCQGRIGGQLWVMGMDVWVGQGWGVR